MIIIVIIIIIIPAAEDEEEEKTVEDKEEGSIQRMDTLASTSLRSIVKAILKIETAQG